MRPVILSLLAGLAYTTAFDPSIAEFSSPINSRKVLQRSIQTRDVPEAPVLSVEQLLYDVTIILGDQLITVAVDTGSFSLWVATPDYTCTNYIANFTHEVCGIVGAYNVSADLAAVQIEDSIYDAVYGSGSAVGLAYNTTMSVAGMEVGDFTFGLADQVDFDSGDQVASGLLG